MWRFLRFAPLIYAAVLLLLAFLAPLRLDRSQLIGLNLAASALYLCWFVLALLPGFRRWLHDRVRDAAKHSESPGADLRNPALPRGPGRVRVRIRRAEGETLDD